MTSPIILALDTSDVDIAARWIEATQGSVNTYKIGLEFFLKHGAVGVARLREAGDFSLFLDLKFHDIPQTVSGAAKSVESVCPKFLTVHAAGGEAMIEAAVAALPSVSITAVTILTSLSDTDLYSLGFAEGSLNSAVRLARLAIASGARSIVCSPLEVAAIREAIPADIELITPGVRPLGSVQGDQVRTMTPSEALAAGANFVVIGRPVTSLWKESSAAMTAAAQSVLDSIYLP